MNERLEARLVVGKVVMSEGRVDLPEKPFATRELDREDSRFIARELEGGKSRDPPNSM
jgi:hypothetical protein